MNIKMIELPRDILRMMSRSVRSPTLVSRANANADGMISAMTASVSNCRHG
jgi:hypothetical protein